MDTQVEKLQEKQGNDYHKELDHGSFIQHVFAEYLQCASYYSGHWSNKVEWNKEICSPMSSLPIHNQ